MRGGGAAPRRRAAARARWLVGAVCCALAALGAAQPQLVLQGRFQPGPDAASPNGTASLPQTFSWAASSVYTSFEGASAVTVSLAAKPANGSFGYGITWFRFFIDGEFAADGFTSYNQLSLAATIPVSSGRHTLRIAKLSDPAKGEAVLSGISLTGGSFLPPSGIPGQVAGRRMLVLGDSYSVGYGDAGAAIPGTCSPAAQQLTPAFQAVCRRLEVAAATECSSLWQILNQNSLQAFGPVAAASLGADFQVIASSGIGMVGYSYAADSNPDLPPEQYEALLPSNQALFNRSAYLDAASQYDTLAWLPQVVVIASGTNDWHSVPPLYSLEEWLAEAVAFLQQVSGELQQPAIIIQAWPPEQQLAGALSGADGVNETIQYLQAMPSLYTQAVRRGVPNVHFMQLDTRGYDNLYNWCDGHPSAAAHRAVAQQLASFVQALLPEWRSEAPISPTVDEAAIRPQVGGQGQPPAPAAAAAALSEG